MIFGKLFTAESLGGLCWVLVLFYEVAQVFVFDTGDKPHNRKWTKVNVAEVAPGVTILLADAQVFWNQTLMTSMENHGRNLTSQNSLIVRRHFAG